MVNLKKTAIAGAVCAIFAGQAQAGSELATLIDMLHEKGIVDDAQYGRLKAEMKTGSEQAAIEKKQAATEKKEMQAKLDKASNVEVKLDKGGLKVKSRDGEFAFKVGGRLQVDSAWYNEDSNAQPGSRYGDGTEIRRARLYIQGKMYNDWGYKLQYDFANSGVANKGIKDAYLTYSGFKDLELKLGNFKDPFMLQEQTSSKYVTFTERALPDAFSAGRHIGLMASTKHKHWTASAGVFGESVSTISALQDEGWGVGGRATYAPVNEKTQVIHFGVAANYRTANAKDTIIFAQQAETHIALVPLVNTGLITDVDDYLKLGFEAAAIVGPFSTQVEYLRTTVDRSASKDLTFDGWYAEAAYFLTGESRNYKKGAFGGVTPKEIVGRGGIGAWQLAARYSTLNLNDKDINGGEADNMTLGVNWFPTPTLRFSANYVNILDVKGGPSDDEELDLFQIRGQWAF
ncbi:MAG: porin [Gammaproteobacteria bacterium]|nr:MAG: porin [Gammaproteobacteria bacterium]RLA24447.1 MAG: porin [Gammaproteobacteria bacterium]